MKITTLTKNRRAQQNTIASDKMQIVSSTVDDIVVSVPLQDKPKDIMVCISRSEFNAMLKAISEADNVDSAIRAGIPRAIPSNEPLV